MINWSSNALFTTVAALVDDLKLSIYVFCLSVLTHYCRVNYAIVEFTSGNITLLPLVLLLN